MGAALEAEMAREELQVVTLAEITQIISTQIFLQEQIVRLRQRVAVLEGEYVGERL